MHSWRARAKGMCFSSVHSRCDCVKLRCDRIVQRVELSECKGSAVAQGRISVKLLFGWDGQRSWESATEEGHEDLFVPMGAFFFSSFFHRPLNGRKCCCYWERLRFFQCLSCWIRSEVIASAALAKLHGAKCPWPGHCVTSNHAAVRMDRGMVM